MTSELNASPPQPSHEQAPRWRAVDSPWFWICLFACVAVAALVAIGPKFRKREARLEATFKMRQHLAQRDASNPVAADDEYVPAPSAENGDMLKTTGPLIWLLLAVAAGSCVMLLRSKPAASASPPPR